MIKIVSKTALKVLLKILRVLFLSRSYNETLEKQEIITVGKPKPKLNLPQII